MKTPTTKMRNEGFDVLPMRILWRYYWVFAKAEPIERRAESPCLDTLFQPA